MKTKDLKHPMQPIGWNETGDIIRFKANKIVRLLLDTSTLNLNQIAVMDVEGKFNDGDYIQLMQLIGYSVSGFGDLELSDEITEKADQIATELIAKEKGESNV
jgi:glutamate 5-kinase